MRYIDFAGRTVSAIGLGTWQFGSSGWGWGRDFNEADAHAIVKRALEMGVTLFDTAEIYGRGQSERILGEALNGLAGEAFIATKLWPLNAPRPLVTRALKGSLERLGTERIDLYQLHWPNPAVPLRWTMGGMRSAMKKGLIGGVGVSNFSLSKWIKADSALGSPVISNQVRYNLLQRTAETDIIPFAQSHDRLVLAYSPLAQGLLTGRYGTYNLPGGYRRANSLFLEENVRRAQPALDTLSEIADAHHASLAQIALAWVIRHDNVAAIPGAKSLRQLEDNVAAADIFLTDDEIWELDRVGSWYDPIPPAKGVRSFAKRLVAR